VIETRGSIPSSDDGPAIVVSDLGKMHRIYARPLDRLKQMLLARFGRRYGHDFWALRHVSFEVARGETLGVVGRNGSGKSTLLQMLAGTLTPTEGEILLSGRVAALLELGSGFSPEFTGRENAVMNGALLGISKREMESRLDAIAAFADIGEFFDQPVRLLSSGMFVRLAFAVAVSVEPDILLIDEALAVGDLFFQQKCYRRLEELRERGVTVILVSHAMQDVERFCRRAVVLDGGRVVFQGDAKEAVRHYYLIAQGLAPGPTAPSPTPPPAPPAEAGDWPSPDAFLDISAVAQVSTGGARCTGVAVCDLEGRPCRTFASGDTARFYYEFEMLSDLDGPVGGISIYNGKAVYIHGKHSLQHGLRPPLAARGARVRYCQDVRLDLGPDEYTFEVGLATPELVHVCHLPAVGRFAVRHSAAALPPFYGIADLAGGCRVTVLAPAEHSSGGRRKHDSPASEAATAYSEAGE
jgi:lipopolysaccharide transport system ATP-binding protein